MVDFRRNHLGTTLIELLVAVAIIGIMTSIFVVQVRLSDAEKLHQATEQTAADLKQLRNLTISRVINENNSFPIGGYGIFFDDASSPSSYTIYADNGHAGYQDYGCEGLIATCPAYCNNYCESSPDFVPDAEIKKYLYDDDITVYPKDLGEGTNIFYYNFTSEHTATTSYSADESLEIILKNTANLQTSQVDILDLSDDGYVWGNIRVQYN
ncbi:type II secretion system protein [Candidatus Nomurabacteria bacterium]|nr:type II secretion system protein [Candidatus Nomurabacteria bacterium]